MYDEDELLIDWDAPKPKVLTPFGVKILAKIRDHSLEYQVSLYKLLDILAVEHRVTTSYLELMSLQNQGYIKLSVDLTDVRIQYPMLTEKAKMLLSSAESMDAELT